MRIDRSDLARGHQSSGLVMTKKKPEAEVVHAPPPGTGSGRLKALGGSVSDAFNNLVVNQALQALWLAKPDTEARDRQYQAAVAALAGIRPSDEIEGMLAAQMVATHSAAMECYRRAMIPDQTFEGRQENLNQANKLTRSYTLLMDALNRHRGKGGQQRVTVEHVHVHQGGQAIVGTIQGGGGPTRTEERAHAQQLAHAPEPPVRCPDPTRDAVLCARGDRQDPL
jgi:hypothetical protein